MLRRCAADGCESTGSLRCSRCKKTYYCSAPCQRSSWKSHKSVCVVLAASLSLGSAQPFEKALDVPTKGAAGWTHFVVDGRDYLAVANFLTSRPRPRPSAPTETAARLAFPARRAHPSARGHPGPRTYPRPRRGGGGGGGGGGGVL